MRQAIHIFKKDARHLRYEIALLLVITAVFVTIEARSAPGSDNSWWTELMLVAVGILVIGRAVLDEEIPGDRQFWVTRPYRWSSLVGAKLLFIAVFVNLPILLAHLSILIADGFPLLASLPGLLWCQAIIFAVVSVPSAALATLVSKLAPFMFIEVAFLSLAAPIRGLMPTGQLVSFGGEEWLRASFGAIVLVAVSLPVLYWQYKKRWTTVSRSFALTGIAAGAIAILVMPWSLALAAQLRFSKEPSLGGSVQAALGPQIAQDYWYFPGTLYIPIALRSVPAGTVAVPDALTFTLEGRDGESRKLQPNACADLTKHTESPGHTILRVRCAMDPVFIKKNRDEVFTLRGSVYLTLFGNARATTIPLSNHPTNVGEGLQCYTDTARSEWDVFCRSAFRWPSRLIYAKLGETTPNTFRQSISYSPFPASLSIDPIETHWASAFAYGPPVTVRDVTIVTEEPLAHLRRDFEARDVRLGDLAFPKRGVPLADMFIPK